MLCIWDWNIGKALGKRRSYTAEFIKKVFAYTMKENEINTNNQKNVSLRNRMPD